MNTVKRNGTPPLVSIVVPCRNEIKFIGDFFENIDELTKPENGYEIILVDGMSDDGTRERILNYAQLRPEIQIVENPQKFTPHGLNLGIKHSRGNIIIRMDIHTKYEKDYIIKSIEKLVQTNADNVGGPWKAFENKSSLITNAISASFSSPFAIGVAKNHNERFEGEVDSVYLGCWKKGTFQKFGLFDEDFIRNQDGEHNFRIRQSGGKVWQSPEIKSWYNPRKTLKELFLQYFQYGFWRVLTLKKYKKTATLRQLVPPLFVASILILLFFQWVRIGNVLLLCEMGLYFLLNTIFSISTAIKKKRFGLIFILPVVFSTYHLSYGLGFVTGILNFLILNRSPLKVFSNITRK